MRHTTQDNLPQWANLMDQFNGPSEGSTSKGGRHMKVAMTVLAQLSLLAASGNDFGGVKA